jgi:4,5-dihydroxyphthalate decarboxylase
MTAAYPKSGPVKLRVNLADHKLFAPLKSGDLSSDLVSFDFCGPKIAHNGFKDMVRNRGYDAGELALVTYMQARAAGLPLVMLPATIVGKFQHHCIAYSSDQGRTGPKDIEGRRVGVRAYSQTTGMWVREILASQFGVDLGKVTWCSHEDPHVLQSPDPAFVERFDLAGRSLGDYMLDGTFSAAIVGNELPKDPRATYLIENPHDAAKEWHRTNKAVQINHVFVVDSDLAEQRPDVVEEIYRLLAASKSRAGDASAAIDTFPFGAAAVESSLAIAARASHEQSLLPRALKIQDLMSDVTRRLGL